MVVNISVNNKIQEYIIEHLYIHGATRFRDLRPPKVDTNLLSYHVTKLVKNNYIKKVDETYELAGLGWQYIDRVKRHPAAKEQPDIISLFIVQNEDGDILLTPSPKSGVDAWTIPATIVDIDSQSLTESAADYARQFFTFLDTSLRHVGDCYLRITMDDVNISHNLIHVFRVEVQSGSFSKDSKWVGLYSLPKYSLDPGIEAIISRSFFGDAFFFEEFNETLYTK